MWGFFIGCVAYGENSMVELIWTCDVMRCSEQDMQVSFLCMEESDEDFFPICSCFLIVPQNYQENL